MDELAAAIAALLHRDLEKKYIEVAKTCLQSGLGTQDRRKQREGLEREVKYVLDSQKERDDIRERKGRGGESQ